MRRCPFSENIDGRVVVSPVRGSTVWARPRPVSERDSLVEAATSRAQFRGREPPADMLHNCPSFVGNMVQSIDKAGKSQVGHFTAPQGFHTL